MLRYVMYTSSTFARQAETSSAMLHIYFILNPRLT